MVKEYDLFGDYCEMADVLKKEEPEDTEESLDMNDQGHLFEYIEPWQEEWQGMPEFNQNKKEAYRTIVIRFRNEDDVKDFSERIGQDFTRTAKSFWHPFLVQDVRIHRRWIDDET